MPGAGGLESRIVEQIIEAACCPAVDSPVRLSIYKQAVPLAAVSRAWRRLALAHLASVLIVECRPAAGDRGEVEATAAVVGSKPKRKGDSPTRSRSVWRSSAAGSASARKNSTATTPALAAAPQWQSNIEILLGAGTSAGVARLRLQSFDVRPEYAGFVGAMTASGFARCSVREVHTIEIVDLSEASGSGTQETAGAKAERWWASDCIAGVAAYLAQAMPAVRVLSSASWSISAASRTLATHLASQYFGQLQALSIALASPVITSSRSVPLLAHALTTLQIQAGVLEKSGAAVVPAAQLLTLKLFEAGPFFSWAPFAGGAEQPDELVFAHLTTLSIDFAKDDVVSIADFYKALDGSKYSVRVTMGQDRRRVVLPALRALSIRKVPYTYHDAWRMFADSPLRKLAVDGRYGHVRYIDCRLLHNLDVLDIHTEAADQAGSRFTSFAKSLLAEPSAARSAWLRHTEPFPLSVPDAVGWTRLEELNICGYVPALTLPALVSRLPCLLRLVVQRIACDSDEATLTQRPDAQPWGHIVPPPAPVSLTVRELQLHMGGATARLPTLQAICYLLLCMPRVRLLAVKLGYWDHVRAFVRQHAQSHPDLASVALVRHVYMRATSPFLILG